MSIYNILRDDDESDEEEYKIRNNYSFCEKFSEKEVNILYNYFVDKGNKNWFISKEHIYASLRRNNGDYNKSGKELDDMISNDNFEIRSFFDKNEFCNKPYLSGQEWQINPVENINLLYDDKVYKVYKIYRLFNNGSFTLNRVLTRDYDNIYTNFADEDVKYGKYKQICDEHLQEQLEKEYNLLCEDVENAYNDREICIKKECEIIENYSKEINIMKKEHETNCTTDSKLKVFEKVDLPIEIIKKISEYGIESECNHYSDIYYVEEDIHNIYEYIDDECDIYKDLQWKKNVAYHVLCGDYEELINDFDWY